MYSPLAVFLVAAAVRDDMMGYPASRWAGYTWPLASIAREAEAKQVERLVPTDVLENVGGRLAGVGVRERMKRDVR
jgi:hypothetical protein